MDCKLEPVTTVDEAKSEPSKSTPAAKKKSHKENQSLLKKPASPNKLPEAQFKVCILDSS